MKKFKTLLIPVVAALTVITFTACSTLSDDYENPGDSLGGGKVVEETADSYDDTSISERVESADTVVIENGDDSSYEGEEYTLVDLSSLTSDYLIEQSGNYVFEGTTAYRIVLSTKGIDAHIFLENATFDSIFSDGKPSSTVITLTGENVATGLVSDGDDDAKGTLYIKNDAVINGDGSISVTSATKNALHGTGALGIYGATVSVNAYKHGVRGNDAVILKNATISAVTYTGDGIQTNNENDDPEKGYVYIEDSLLDIDAGDDGIQAATFVHIVSGTIDVTTNGGAPSKITETSSDNADGKGIKVGTIEYAVADEDLADELAKGDREDTGEDEDGMSIVEILDHDYYSIVIDGGTITVDSNDDAIHSDGDMIINGGTFVLTSGDDAMHAERLLKISDGSVTVNRCYEGIEGAKIEIYGGDITVSATDDGINAADGTGSRVNVSNSNCYILINGGTVQVNASGDGIDSNGIITVNGGAIYVDGPTSGADTALDSDGGILINGGTLAAVGSSGMVETPGSNSSQCVVSYATASTVSAGSKIELTDSDGNVLISFTSSKSFQSAILSCSSLTKGSTYSLYINGSQVKSFQINSTITSIGTQSAGGNNAPGGDWGFTPGGFGGAGGRR